MSPSKCMIGLLWGRVQYITLDYYKTFSDHTASPLRGGAQYVTSKYKVNPLRGRA